MNLPGFTGQRSIFKSKDNYQTNMSFERAAGTNSKITPSLSDCQKNCFVFFWSPLLLSGCMANCELQGGGSVDPREDRCRTNPCFPECPADQCILSQQRSALTVPPPPPSGGSRIDTEDLKRQLNRIERCACGNNRLRDAVSSYVSSDLNSLLDYDWPRTLPNQ